MRFGLVWVLGGAFAFAGACAHAQDQPPSPAPPASAPNEKPQQLARPNGNTPVDTNQSGQPGTPDTATPAQPLNAPAQKPAATTSPQAQATTPSPAPPGDWTDTLRRYDGTFRVKPDGPGAAQETYRNTCQKSGKRFFECERVQNNETIALRIFVPGDDPGHYFTQDVLPSGTATGRGDLFLDGDRWVFSTQETRDSGALDYRRLTLSFSNKDENIRYVGERSDDGQHWMQIFSGNERRQK